MVINKNKMVGDMLKRNTLKEQVRTACLLAGISMTELGKHMGMSQQSISKRLSNGKFTKEEMYQMAEILGCEYHSYFEFPNGNKIY